MHPSAATLLESVGELTLEGVVDVGVGHVDTVAGENDGMFAALYFLCQDVGLSGSLNHTDGISTIDGFEQTIALYVIAVSLQIVSMVHHMVRSCCLKVYVVDAE